MTKLISGRIEKTSSANVSAERYQFLRIEEAEPDLGLPSQLGQIFTSDLSGNRRWTTLDTANVTETTNQYFTNARVLGALVTSNVNVDNLYASGTLYANGLTIRNISVTDNVLLGNVTAVSTTSNTLLADTVTANVVTSNTIVGNRITGNVITSNTIVADVITANSFASTGVGTPTLSSATSIILNANGANGGAVVIQNSALRLKTYTTEAANALTASAGDVIFNSNTNTVQSYNGTSWIKIGEGISSSQVSEGVNLFYTNSRVLSAVTPLLTTANTVELNNLYFTHARVLSALAGNNVSVNDLTVAGDLIVQGNTVTLNTSTVVVEDKNILLANGAINAAAADGAGISIAGADANITYVNTGDKFVISKTTEIRGNISADAWLNLYTSNVIESTNQYFTNVRVLQAVNPLLTTANVLETTNQYFTNVRVLQAVNPLLTTANVIEDTNLYFSNSRVYANIAATRISVHSDVDLTGILPGDTVIWDGNNLIAGSGYASGANITDLALRVVAIENHTTDELPEGNVNLYFTNARVRGAISAGRGISIDHQTGTITSLIYPSVYNLTTGATKTAITTDTMANAMSFSSTVFADRYIGKSLHATNISDEATFISANIHYANGNIIPLAYKIGIPVGGALEFLKRTQIFAPGDAIYLQGFNSSGAPTNGQISTSLTYETISDGTYNGKGYYINNANTNVEIFSSPENVFTIIESIKLVNLTNNNIPAKTYWANATNVAKAYFSYNLPIPPNSIVEVLQGPKRIEGTEKIVVNANDIGLTAFISYRLESTTGIDFEPTSINPSDSIIIGISTSELDGTTLYYSIEPV